MKYRKKPIIVEAFRWNGVLGDLLSAFATNDLPICLFPLPSISIKTLEGNMLCNIGDYIIRGVAGEIYPCKSDIFLATYEAVDE